MTPNVLTETGLFEQHKTHAIKAVSSTEARFPLGWGNSQKFKSWNLMNWSMQSHPHKPDNRTVRCTVIKMAAGSTAKLLFSQISLLIYLNTI